MLSGALAAAGAAPVAEPQPAVPVYTSLDLRFGWKPLRGLEFSVTGRNPPDGRHSEFGAPAPGSQSGRGIFVKVV